MTDCTKVMAVLEPILADKKGVIFDMDGTLLDSMTMWRELDNEYLRSMGIEPDEEYNKAVAAMTLPMASEYICRRYGSQVPYTPSQVLAQITGIMDDYYRNKLLVKPLVPSLVCQLKDRGIKMMVATANEYNMCEMALTRNQVMQYMEGIITCTMAGAGKEHPTVYLKACDIMGISVDECVVFEDTLHSVKTAREAGFTVVGVYDLDAAPTWQEICSLADAHISLDG